jgi:acetyl-CoA acetyltransferase
MSAPFRPRPVYIADSFMLPVGRYDGRHREKRSFFQMLEALQEMLDRAPVPRSSIECVIVGSQNPFAFSKVDNVAAKAAGVLGISGVKSLLVDTASSSGASAFEAAYMEIAAGRYDQVLAIGIQKMSDASTAEATRIVAGVIDQEEAEFGLTMPACGALVAQALMAEFKLSPEAWSRYSARWTERAQHFAARNPLAHLAEEIPVERYFAEIESGVNYLYYEPLRYHDFCPMSDGIAACLLSADPQPVVVAGVGSGTDIPTIADRRTFTTFPATRIALKYALGMAGLPDLQALAGNIHINMHDPFNGFGPINLVDLGVVPRARLLDGLLDEALTGENGRFPTNLTGGLKGRGHPLGATGMVQIVENHQMIVSGRFQAGLSHSIGGPINNNVVVLLEASERHAARNPVPYRPRDLPVLSRMKPARVSMHSLFEGKSRVSARLVAQTTRHHFKTGEALNTLLLFEAPVEKENYRFLIAVDPAARETLTALAPGAKLLLRREGEQITVNDVPIRRFYRKTLGGIMELAEAAMRKLRGPK